MVTEKLILNYLFGAKFEDGLEYFQNEDDVSVLVPTRSSYYDICQHDSKGNTLIDTEDISITREDLIVFQLEGQNNKYLVDLRDGHFEVNGVPFFIKHPPKDTKLRLVYYRKRRHHMIFAVRDGELQSVREAAQECEYHIGWKYDGMKEPCVLSCW